MDEEEGESQFWSDVVCTQKFLEQFRWAYTKRQKLICEADGYPYSGHYAKNIVLGSEIFEKISVYVQKDLNFTPYKSYYKGSYGRVDFYFGDALTISTRDKYDEMAKYLFPSNENWEIQIEALKLITKKEKDRTKLLERLAIFPYQEYTRFTAKDREDILNIIVQGSITEDYIGCVNDEEIVINLIKYISDEDLADLFSALQKNNLMQKLCAKIQNSFGEENYTKFIGTLTSTFMRYRKDDINYVTNNWAEYTKEQSNNGIMTHYVWDRSNSVYMRLGYKKKYENNKIIITTKPGGFINFDGGFHSYTRPPLDPFEIVSVYFRTPPKHISKDLPADIWFAMPAFMFEWYLNEFQNKQVAKYLDGAVTIASFIIPVTSISKGYKVLAIIHASINAANVLLLNDRIEEIVETYLDPKALEGWQSFSYIATVAESPFQDLILDKNLSNTTQFFALWNIFKNTDKYGYLMNDKASREAIQVFESLKSEIELILNENNESY